MCVRCCDGGEGGGNPVGDDDVEICPAHLFSIVLQQISYRCLIGFIQSLGNLSAQCLSSLKRELQPDPRLFLLLDYVVQNANPKSDEEYCLKNICETPDIYFQDGNQDLKLSAYAFRYMGQKGVVGRCGSTLFPLLVDSLARNV